MHYTDNMTLVAYLLTCRIRHSQTELRGNQVIWVFRLEPDFAAALGKFDRRHAQVEPVEFHRALTKVRREMNGLLGR
jgi:hypothetical protein